MLNIIQRSKWPLLLIAIAGLGILSLKCWLVYPVKYPGHFDSIAYANMADSFIHGRGFSADYITVHFIKYPREIEHPEDHWPPLHSIAIIPFFLLFGTSTFVGKLPSILISSLLLPLVVYFLAKSLSKSRIAGLCSALTIMILPFLFRDSLYILSDITYAFVVCLTALFAIKGMEKGKYFYLMGVFIGLAYYAKGFALVLIPAYILFYLYCRRSIKALLMDRRFLTGLLIAFLIVTPWLVRNAVHYGNPFHSTQNYVGGYIGWGDWESKTFPVYWDKEKPSWMGWKLGAGVGKLAQMSGKFMKTHLWWMLVDITSRPPEKIGIGSTIGTCFRGFPKLLHGVPMLLFAIPALVYPFFARRNRNVVIVWLLSASVVIFLSVFWEPISRLLYPTIPLIVSLGWVGYYALFRFIFRRTRFSRLFVCLSLSIMLLVVSAYSANAIYHSWQSGKNSLPYADGKAEQQWIDVSEWLKDNVPPDSIIMAHEPKSIHYFSDLKAVKIPYDDLKNIVRVMEYYRVTHIIPSRLRPQLDPLVSGKIPGIELLHDGPMRVFKVRYDLLPRDLLEGAGEANPVSSAFPCHI